MANTVTAVYQKSGMNFKATIFKILLTSNYAAPEVVSLTSSASNPSAEPVTGPSGNGPLPPRIVSSNIAGYVPSLVSTGTPGQYDLTFAYGATAFSGAYAAGAEVVVEVDHGLSGL